MSNMVSSVIKNVDLILNDDTLNPNCKDFPNYLRQFLEYNLDSIENFLFRKENINENFYLYLSILGLYLYYFGKARIFVFPTVRNNHPTLKYGIGFFEEDLIPFFEEYKIKEFNLYNLYLQFLRTHIGKDIFKNIYRNINRINSLFLNKKNFIYVLPFLDYPISGRSYELSLYTSLFLEKDILETLLTGEVDNDFFIKEVRYIEEKQSLISKHNFKNFFSPKNLNHFFELLYFLNDKENFCFLYIKNKHEDDKNYIRSYCEFFYCLLSRYIKSNFSSKFKNEEINKRLDKLLNFYKKSFLEAFKKYSKPNILVFSSLDFSKEQEIINKYNKIYSFISSLQKDDILNIAYKGPVAFTPYIALALYKVSLKKNTNYILHKYSSSEPNKKYVPCISIENRCINSEKDEIKIEKKIETLVNNASSEEIDSINKALLIVLNINNYSSTINLNQVFEKLPEKCFLKRFQIDSHDNPYKGDKLKSLLIKVVEREILDIILQDNYKYLFFDIISPLPFAIALFFLIFKSFFNMELQNKLKGVYIYDNNQKIFSKIPLK